MDTSAAKGAKTPLDYSDVTDSDMTGSKSSPNPEHMVCT